jgi:hypothetical protein
MLVSSSHYWPSSGQMGVVEDGLAPFLGVDRS